jgi:hypothetical protein
VRAPAAVLVGVAVFASAACGAEPPVERTVAPPRARPTVAVPPTPQVASGPTVREIADALDAIHPTRHPRDNTASCAVTAGCLGLVTTGTVSIYQWPDVSSAARFVGEGSGTADRIGPYVLSYRTREQRVTSAEVRRAYADRVRAMVGPAP